ncbi:MAG: hypothetical protein KDA21_08915 [Phycisphaerales bacterium]|nr:hypothetical protein [Phycisphaerales bacterium]
MDVQAERSLLEQRLDLIVRSLSRVAWVRGVGLPLVVALMSGVILAVQRVTLLRARSSTEYTIAIGFIVMLMLLGLLGPLTSARSARRLWQHFRRDCAAAGWCPACGYELRSAGVEADGCRVCPECGGAWRDGAHADGDS